jgi:two-component system response regulator FixJ
MTDIHVIEDDPAVAASLEALLNSWGYDCTRFESGEAFLASADEPPSCILLDVRLPGQDGLAVLDAYRRKDGQTPVIIMTGHGDVNMAVDALQRGAQDFVEKPFDGDALVEKIKTAIERAGPDVLCRQKLDRLTPRESDVLRQIVAGHPNKVIAHNLGISPKTVELHRARVMEKTESRSVSQLIRIAVHGGLESDAPT